MKEREEMSNPNASGRGTAARWRAALRHMVPAILLAVGMLHPPLSIGQSARGPAVAANESLMGMLASRPTTLAGQSATQLANGQWLVLGGTTPNATGNQARLIDGAGKSTLLSPTLHTARRNHSATLLPDGTVLVFGGIDAKGNTLTDPEIFVPTASGFSSLANPGLLARSGHSATVLTDGRLLIAGGADASGSALRTVELYDATRNQVERVNSAMDPARIQHIAALLPSAKVLLWGGGDGAGQTLPGGSVFDAGAQQFSAVALESARTLAESLNPGTVPALVSSVPVDQAKDVLVAQRLMVRFSQRMAVASLNAKTVTLIGPSGPVAIQPVPVEAGMLLFITPKQELLPGTAYTLFVQGATDQFGQALPLTAVGFKTVTLGTQATQSATTAGIARAVLATTAATTQAGAAAAATAGSTTANGTTATPKTPAVASAAFAAANQAAADAAEDSDIWIPGPGNFGGKWRRGNREVSRQHEPKNERLRRVLYGYPELMKLTPADVAQRKIPDVTPPADGVTGVAGQVLRLNGRPLVGATLSIGSQKVVTDENGEFLLAGVPSGRQILVIDGDTANRGDRHYGRYEYGVKIEEGHTTQLPFVIWMSRLNPRTVKLASPTATETIVTNPQIPGMELRIPAGMVVRDAQGKIVTEISMTAIPVNQPPFPLPHIEVPVYFSIQPGGSRLEGINANAKGAQLIYPNYPNAAPGTRMTFWDYDATNRGWFEYGHGTVTADGKQVVPDADVRIYEFTGAMITTFTPESQAPSAGPAVNCECDAKTADPVDTSTGLFLNPETDLVIPDVVPITIGRSYRQADLLSRAFGIGTNLSYDIFLVGGYDSARDQIKPYTYLILPDGGRVYFTRVSGGTGYTSAVFQSVAAPGSIYYGAIVKWDNVSYPGASWSMVLKNGTTYFFPGVGDGGGNARTAAVLGIKDRLGNVTQLVRTNGNLTQIISPNGRNVYLTYDTSNRVTQIRDDLQRTTTYAYDTQGRLIKVTDPLGKTRQYTWATQTVPAAHSIGGVTTSHNLLTVQDKNGNIVVTNTYDANGRVATQTYADGRTFSFAYTLLSASQTIPAGSFDAVTQTDATDERGTVTRYVFNNKQAITSVTAGQGTNVAQTLAYNWNPNTNLLDSVTDTLGRTTAYQYDSLGNKTQVTAAYGTSSAATTKVVWDLNYSRPASITDPNNNTITFSYDKQGNLIKSTDALNHSVTLTYDGQGRPSSVADALNATTTFSYSGADLQTVTDPLGHAASQYTDAVGRPTSKTNALGRRSYLAFDALDRIISLTDPKGGVAQVSYDPNGNLLTQVDQNNNTTSFAYDGRDRLTRTTDALARVTTLAYEPGGRVSQTIDNKGQATNVSFDPLGRPTLMGFGATASDGNPTSTIAFTWDAGNRVTQFVDSVGGTITRSYDVFDRLTSETTPQGGVSYTYDAGGRRKTMTVAGQPTVSYTWDAANRLTQIQQAAGATNGNTIQTIGFSYDAANRRTQTTYANGIVATYSYDAASQLIGIAYKKADGTLIGDLAYTYDAAGQRTGMGGSLARVDSGTAVSTTEFNANNQLVKWNNQSLSYDANGNLTSDGTNTYTWDERNQLRGISGAITASFQYDALGRRISKTIGSNATGYLYDGANFVQEKNGSGVTANLVNGPGMDKVYMRQSSAGNHSMLSDALGSILMATDATQAIVTSYSYDAYGATTQTGTNDNSQQYTGRENDGTGLYFHRARYYSPQLGRFISADPIGWASGQTNNYAYVRGNPISYRDPRGTNPLAGALTGAEIGSMAGPVGAVVGGVIGAGIGAYLGWNVIGPIIAQNSEAGVPDVPTDLIGDNPRSSSGQRVNTDLPSSDFPGTVDDLTGGQTSDQGGHQVCPNGVRVRPGKHGNGPRIDIPANGTKPPETIHFPPGTPWLW
ncbi:RHS repeat-associated core domain-containing protein [Cupriavidus sp. SIMBA_020]|uniref:RHS repeat-associated core domain-containing protein n=1 Tax=Cupriavidus sp. SIMBA_020 TaxID=3085766 RepID=UPI00397C3182